MLSTNVVIQVHNSITRLFKIKSYYRSYTQIDYRSHIMRSGIRFTYEFSTFENTFVNIYLNPKGHAV